MMEVDSDEDLTKELQPLAYHVSDRKRVLMEAFRALKGKRLEAMIPPTLKAWNRPKLESACLSVLEDLDDETLLAILDGRLRTAGVTAVEQPASPETDSNVKVKNSKKKLSKIAVVEETIPDEPKKKKKKKVILSDEDTLKALKLKKKKKLAKERMKEKLKKKKKAAAAAATESAPAPHKSLMELLELEYRAKAIKALLRSQGQSVPDIPINIEGEEEPETPPTEATPLPVATTATAGSQTNGTDSTSTVTKSSAQTKSSASLRKPKPKQKRQINPENSNVKPATDSSRNEPQKEVKDLIDEALNIQVAEGIPTENDKPPSTVIAEACAAKSSDTEENLRSKLLRKYQKQQQQQPEEKEEVVQKPKKKRKKKPLPDQNNDNEEDILDLHPRELNLSDEDHQTSENDSSEYETDSESISMAVTTPNTKESVEADSNKGNLRSKVNDEEELLYDDNESDDGNDEVDGSQKDSKNPDRVLGDDEGNSNQSNKDSEEENENKLWEDVQDVSNSTREADVQEGSDLQNEETLPSESKESGSEDEPPTPNENSQSEMVSEKTHDDVFENISGQATSKSSAFPGQSQGALKRRITFRIDPARIGALEEQAVEEEAKREAERKKEEEEEEKERLAKQLEEEVEEGEIDSNEEETQLGNSPSSSPRKSERNSSPEREARWNKSKSSQVEEDSDSADSQDSASGYSTRRPYRRKASSSRKRDFGRYSPKKLETSGKQEEESPKKRPNSPVEFITQFSDMEPISDEDSNEGSQTSSMKRKKVKSNLPVQGCATKPAEDQAVAENETDLVKDDDCKEDSENKERNESEEEEEEEDDLPKPVTWYERWAESHGMQKVVKTNKIHRKVKNKMKQVKTAKQKQPEVPKVPEPSIEAEPIIGSIEEYEKLFGKKVINKEPESSVQADNTTSNDKAAAEEENDDDADDLWGDIIGDS